MYLLQRLRAAQQVAATAKEQRTDGSARSGPSSAPRSHSTSNAPNRGSGCRLCGASLPKVVRPETYCEHCRSPLSPVPQLGSFAKELFGRRASPRTAKSHRATIYPVGRSHGITVKMRDLSLNGISFYSDRTRA
jgi:hypothetical protein